MPERYNPEAHLITIDDLTTDSLESILHDAQSICDSQKHLSVQSDALKHVTLANLFFENSTRTRASFELAAKRLGATVLNLPLAQSSLSKGEAILDTFNTLQAMYCNLFTIRHGDHDVLLSLAAAAKPSVHLINAGSGTTSHPTQALLDVLTIRQSKPDLKKLSVVIAGDILHSRVANSLLVLLSRLGVNDIRLTGPNPLLPKNIEKKSISISPSLAQACDGADVVIMLRIQLERMPDALRPDPEQYAKQFGLNNTVLKCAKPDAIVLHPGPINRGLEISSEVADGVQSCIIQQVENGVALRMAVMRHFYKDS